MPHAPPRAPSRGEDDSDTSEFKTLLLTEKVGDIILSTPPIPDRSMFRQPNMGPTRAVFHRGQDYPSSLSDTSEESSSSHSCLDDDELESPTAATAAVAMEDRVIGVDAGGVDDGEFFDCLEGCEIDDSEAVDDIEAETESLIPLAEEKLRGAIAVVISYIFVGKPKMVDIAHSPRSSNDSRRWGLPPASRPTTVHETPSLGSEQQSGNNGPETRLVAPPDRSITNTPLPKEAEPLFLAQPYSATVTTTTVCYSDNSASKSSWRGLVRSVSRRRKRAPKESAGEEAPKGAPKEAPKEEPEKAMVIEAKAEKPQRRPRGLGLKLQKSRLQRGSPTAVTA